MIDDIPEFLKEKIVKNSSKDSMKLDNDDLNVLIGIVLGILLTIIVVIIIMV